METAKLRSKAVVEVDIGWFGELGVKEVESKEHIFNGIMNASWTSETRQGG